LELKFGYGRNPDNSNLKFTQYMLHHGDMRSSLKALATQLPRPASSEGGEEED
jgi:hypothetical protein